MSANKDFSGAVRPSPQTVTKEQRLKLLRDRARYELHEDFRPRGSAAAEVHKFVEKQRESQVAHIENRMSAAHSSLQEGRAAAVHEGYAKASFNQQLAQQSSQSQPQSQTQNSSASHDTGRER